MSERPGVVCGGWPQPSPAVVAAIERLRERYDNAMLVVRTWNEPVGVIDGPGPFMFTGMYTSGAWSSIQSAHRDLWWHLCGRPRPGSLLARRTQSIQRRRAAKRRRSKA